MASYSAIITSAGVVIGGGRAIIFLAAFQPFLWVRVRILVMDEMSLEV